MDDIGTIILAVTNNDLYYNLESAFPNMKIINSYPYLPNSRIEGCLWCYVDLILPNISGIEYCRRLRRSANTAHSHITVVVDQDSSEARRLALSSGANDYMIGPLDHKRLAEHLLDLRDSTSTIGPTPTLIVGNMFLDSVSYMVKFNNKPISLSRIQFRLLSHFLRNPDTLFTKSNLKSIIGSEYNNSDISINMSLCRLRKALTDQGVPNPLRTIRERGVVFDSEALCVSARRYNWPGARSREPKH